jgi:2-polyprenyl-3-methyl-5-hydroxy-6-metoxy-1,4-benzoquinol methylase
MSIPIADASMPQLGTALHKVLSRQLETTPAHEPFLRKRFAQVEPQETILLERLARVILDLAGDDPTQYCLDYDWLARIVLEEELFFRRHDRYRLETLEQAIEEVYARPALMTRYMNGLLMSQLWWSNHTRALLSYEQDFLAAAAGRCLEIGPGHGLLMHLAARSGFESVESLDISEASLVLTRAALGRMGGRMVVAPDTGRFAFHAGDLFDPQIMAPFASHFDGVVFSEVLEHLDRPAEAMQILFAITRPGGRVFLHVPVNSPAPDHLFLLRSPEEARSFVGGFGFDVRVARSFPGANLTLERAVRTQSTISCVFVLQKPMSSLPARGAGGDAP